MHPLLLLKGLYRFYHSFSITNVILFASKNKVNNSFYSFQWALLCLQKNLKSLSLQIVQHMHAVLRQALCKSAYEVFSLTINQISCWLWKMIWKIKVPYNVAYFTWLWQKRQSWPGDRTILLKGDIPIMFQMWLVWRGGKNDHLHCKITDHSPTPLAEVALYPQGGTGGL